MPEKISQTLTPSKLKSYWGIKKLANTVKITQKIRTILTVLMENMFLLIAIIATLRLMPFDTE